MSVVNNVAVFTIGDCKELFRINFGDLESDMLLFIEGKRSQILMFTEHPFMCSGGHVG